MAPAFHTIAGQLLGLDVSYDLFPRAPTFDGQLEQFLVELAEHGYRGVNITVPFKATAWRGAAQPDADVVSMGVANTLLLGPDGPTHAYNTDFSGFKWAYRRRFGAIEPGVVALLGAGGVGTATATALVDLGATAIRIFDIVPEHSHALARSLGERNDGVEITMATSAVSAAQGADGVVNGTPVGMYFQPGTPIDPAAIAGQRWVFDAIYSPVETVLMQPCRRSRSATDQRARSVPRPGDRRLRDVHRPSPQPGARRRPGGAHRGRGAPANPVTAGDAVSVRQSTNEPGAAQNG